MNMTYLSYALREVTTRRGRSIAAIAGMSIGIALYVSLAALSDGYSRLIQLPFARLAADVTIQKSSGSQSREQTGNIRIPLSNQPIDEDQIATVKSLKGIKVMTATLLLWEQSRKGLTVISGIDPTASSIGPARVQGWVETGRPLGDQRGEALMEKHFAKFHRKKIGDKIALGGHSFTIVGLVEQKEGSTVSSSNVYISIEAAREIAGLPQGAANMIFATLEPGVAPEVVRKGLAGVIPGAILSTSDNIGDMMKGFNKIAGEFSTMMQYLALLFAAIISYKIFSGSVNERAWEIGLMKTVGWRRRDVVMSFLAESAMLGLAAGIVGLLVGYVGAYFLGHIKISLTLPWNLSPVPAGVGNAGRLNVQAVTLPIAVSWQTVIVSLMTSTTFGSMAGIVISSKLAAVKARDAMRKT
jgi:putative ABC transport system permease protein